MSDNPKFILGDVALFENKLYIYMVTIDEAFCDHEGWKYVIEGAKGLKSVVPESRLRRIEASG